MPHLVLATSPSECDIVAPRSVCGIVRCTHMAHGGGTHVLSPSAFLEVIYGRDQKSMVKYKYERVPDIRCEFVS